MSNVKKADALGIEIYETAIDRTVTLRSVGTSAPYEYEDGGAGICQTFEIAATLMQ